MESYTEASSSEKPTGVRSKTSGIPASTRQQRNQAEKQRRDRLNGYISELATIVPMVSNASKPLDKVSILRLAAAQMRLNFSCLNPKRFKCKPVTLPPSVISYLDVIEKTIGGFIVVTTFSGCIVFCSKSIEDYVGYQNIDVMGNSVYNYIHNGDLTYFEKKVNSVISSQKKGSKKKTKVIKAHMQQRPLPRSNDIRYRKMIFKISVHLNDPKESSINGQTETTGKVKKAGRLKDFGSSAVVLMFIEPVRLEPEIDISYIESHQDAYFTMHGLQGEIIYADQRISSITGYMPHDVQGTSAYQYICSSDVPIALFAQKDMFSSNDGTGVIVYRLRIRDMRFIYLQSTGQIAYKDSSSEISHFVCFNKLLSDDEGSQELKKFQQRFAPQIMAAKALQGKKKNGEDHSQHPELPMNNTPTLIDSFINESRNSAQLKCESTKGFAEEGTSGNSDQNLSSEGFVSPASSAVASSSVHSSDGHSLTSPISDGGSTNSGASEYSNKWSFPARDVKSSDQLEFMEQHCSIEQQEQNIDSLKNGYGFAVDSFDSAKNAKKELGFSQTVLECGLNMLVATNSSLPVKHINESSNNEQNDVCVVNNSHGEKMHSVNAFSILRDNTVNGTMQESFNNYPMDITFECGALQNTFTVRNMPSTYSDLNGATNVSHQNYDFMNVNGHASSYVSTAEVEFMDSRNHLQINMTKPLCAQQVSYNGEHASGNISSHSSDPTNFSELYEMSPNLSLSQNPNSLPISSFENGVTYSSGINSYSENGSCSSGYLSSSGNGYENGGPFDEYNGINVLSSKAFNNINPCGFSIPTTSGNVLSSFSPRDDDLLDVVSLPQIPTQSSLTNSEFKQNLHYSRVDGMQPPFLAHKNGNSDVYASNAVPQVAMMSMNGGAIQAATDGTESTLSKELYRELDTFFQNLPQTETQGETVMINETSDVFTANNSYLLSNISSRAKTNYHQ